MKKHANIGYAALGLLLALTMLLAASCEVKVQAQDLMEGVAAQAVPEKQADEAFILESMRFSLSLFQASARPEREQGTSLLLSPLSVEYALAMAANGAKGQTQEEMRSLLAGNLSMEELNAYLHTMGGRLQQAQEKCRVQLANSVWYRDDPSLEVKKAFLQTNADYYGADAFKASFDKRTVKDINHWIEKQTDGLIDRMIEEITDEDMLFLINTVLFDAEWQSIYPEENIREGVFTARDGKERTVSFLHSTESVLLRDGRAQGFYKAYAGGKYRFVALLPDEGIDVFDYLAELTPEGLLQTLQNGTYATVHAAVPKFESAYAVSLKEILSDMGMPSAFDFRSADFTEMATCQDALLIGDVMHKTFIAFDERGTKAGAATLVQMESGGAEPEEPVEITLDRPFMYLIIDTETNLPLFIGVQTEIS